MFEVSSLDQTPFIIAEVGQNHQGDLEIAKQYVRIFASEGASAVKFQIRNNRYLFSPDAYNKIYDSENSFGSTYGEHRENLELKPEWLPLLKQECVDNGVLFMATPFDEPSLDLLLQVGVDVLKIASFDLGNLPFVTLFGKSGKPLILSTGGGNLNQIASTVDVLKDCQSDFAVLHCVSEYPCDFNRLGLSTIQQLKKELGDITVGLSDHFNGTLSGPIAYLLGARVFEKHVTLNRAWKGTDHSFALERDGFRRFVRDIGRVSFMLPPKDNSDIGNELVFQKLGKSIVAKSRLEIGQIITAECLSGKIFTELHIPVREAGQVIGRKIQANVAAGEPIEFRYFE
jgi:sialic acid synthase